MAYDSPPHERIENVRAERDQLRERLRQVEQAKQEIRARYEHKVESMARYPNQGNAGGLVALTEVLQILDHALTED